MDPEPLQSFEPTQSSAAASYADESDQSDYGEFEQPQMSQAGNQAAQRFYSQQMSSTPALSYTPAPAQSNASVAGQPLQSIDPSLAVSYPDEPLQSIDPSLAVSYPDEPNQSVDPSAAPALNYTPVQPNISIPDALRLNPQQPNMSYATPPNSSDTRRTGANRNGQAGQPGTPTNGQRQQGEGGQSANRPAGSVPAAGMSLVQAAPTPHARGGGAASADPENAAQIDQIVAPVPLNLPVIVPLAPAEMPNVFTPPAALDAGDLHVAQPPTPVAQSPDQKPPSTDAQERAAGRRILAQVAERYGETRRDAETMHQALIQHGDEAVRALVDAYYQTALQIPGILIAADAQLQSSFDAATSQVISAADSADQEIVRQFNQAKRTLGGALGSGLKAVKANAESASQQITTILTDLSSGYVKILSDAALDGETQSLEAYNAVESWKINFNTNYPVTPSFGKVSAMAEAWQKVAPKLGDQAMGKLSQATIEYQTAFSQNTEQVKTDISNSVKPTLQQHADKIGTEGVKNVTDAHTTALNGLRKQTRAARDAVADMRKSTIQQLDARRQAARTELEVETQQTMAGARHEASMAIQSVSASLTQSLPHYGSSVERYHTMLTDAEDAPPESLQAMADAGAPPVLDSLTEARDLQVTQLGTVTASVQRSETSRVSDLYSSLTLKVFDAANEMQATAFETANALNQTAAEMTAGFSAVANGVNAAAQSWSTPLSKAFEEYIKDNQKELDRNKEEKFKPQIEKSKQQFIDWVTPQRTPETFFQKSLDAAWGTVYERITRRLEDLNKSLSAGIVNKIDEGGVTGALRGLTPAQGYAMRYEWEVERGNGSLERTLLYALNRGTDDYNAAINYLNGNTALGAKYELEASMHWYNDEEDRIKAVMRSLTPEQLEELHGLDGWAKTEAEVESSLTSWLGDATLDSNVFQALDDGNHFLAQAYEEKDAIDRARESGNEDALNERLAALSQKPDSEQYGGIELSGAQRREGVERAFAAMQGKTLNANGQPLTQAEAADVMLAYATRPIEMVRATDDGRYETYTSTVGERQTELARALLHQGEGSNEARAARVVVELNRPGGAKILNLDTALYDARLDPNNTSITPEQRQEAQAEHDRMLQLAAENYARMSLPGQSAEEAKAVLVQGLQKGHEPGSSGARLGEALINEPYPTPATAAIAMEYGMEGSGTKEELLNRFTGRMSRDEIQQMVAIYNQDGKRDLYAELGIFGHGTLGELSGDDRLQMERNFLGVPQNDQERFEAAQFAIQQQRDEAGGLGSFLAGGSYQDRSLDYNEARLNRIGGKVRFVDGRPIADPTDDYRTRFKDGDYQGDTAEFGGSILGSTLSAQNYAAKIDQYANFVANAIAIAGVVVAAVVTVATGGAAGPLLMAAIAGTAGLLAMGANYAIKGGRYGWEQAFTDLGMTAVQALTAGVGQGLGLASRGGVQGLKAGMKAGLSINAARQLATSGTLGNMGRLTGSALTDKLLIGAAGSGLSAVGQTALSEQTYEKGAGGAADELLFSLFRGMVTGGVTTGVSHALEAIPVAKLAGGQGRLTLGDAIGETTSYGKRAAGKALVSGVGGFFGKETELGLGAASGRYHGDMGDAFVASAEAGLQSAFQSTAEGVGEARAQKSFNTYKQQAANAPHQPINTAPTQPEPVTAASTTQAEPTAVPRPTGEEAQPTTARPVGEEVQPTLPRPVSEETEPGVRAPQAETPAATTAPELPSGAALRPSTPAEEAPLRAIPTADGGEAPPRLPGGEGGGGGDGRRPSPEEARANEILEVMLTEIQQKRQMAGGKLVDDEFERLPQPQEQALRGGEGTADRTTVSERVAGSLRSRARRAFGRALQDALQDPSQHTALTQKTLKYLLPDQVEFVLRTGRLPRGFDFDHFLTVADFPEFAHRPDVGAALPRDVHREAAHGGDTTRPREAATMLDPEAETRPPFHIDPEAAETPDTRLKSQQQQIAEGLATSGDIDADILIEQRAELAEMQGRATSRRNGGQPDAALERQIAARQAFIAQLEQQVAARPTAAPEAPMGGTAAGIVGSRFRGDALEKPRADIGEDVKTAVGILVKEGSTAQFTTPTDDANVLKVKPLTGEGEVTVRIVPTDTMLPEADGLVPVARFRHNPVTKEYDVLVSSRAPKDTIERALAHELTEIRSAHRQEVIPNALKPGGFGSPNDNSQIARLSHHDQGRLAELEVLARQIEAATKSKDEKKLLQLHEDTQQLLAHLGVIEETSGARARLEVVQGEVDDKPAVRKLVDDQVEAARKNPFLKVLPAKAKALNYAELLLDQLDYAMRLGDQARVDRVMAKALASAYFKDNKIVFELDSLAARTAKERPKNSMAYGIKEIRQIAAGESKHNRRARALEMIIDRIESLGIMEQIRLKKLPRRTAHELAASDPEYAAAIHRRNAEGTDRAPGIVPWPYQEVPKPDLALPIRGPQDALLQRMRELLTELDSPNAAARAAAYNEINQMPFEAFLQMIIRLQNELETTSGLAEREAIEKLLEKLPQQGSLKKASENIGMAAAMRFAQSLKVHPMLVDVFEGSKVPDMMFDLTPSGRVVVIEAKGGTSGLGVRKETDGDTIVQQGTKEYLISLAKDMQRSSSKTIRDMGEKLENAIAAGTVDYYLVRQPYQRADGTLGVPTVATFDITRGGKKVQ